MRRRTFGTMGMIAGIAAFIAGAVMLVLSGLGLMHARRVSPAAEILSGHPANGRTAVPASDQAALQERGAAYATR